MAGIIMVCRVQRKGLGNVWEGIGGMRAPGTGFADSGLALRCVDRGCEHKSAPHPFPLPFQEFRGEGDGTLVRHVRLGLCGRLGSMACLNAMARLVIERCLMGRAIDGGTPLFHHQEKKCVTEPCGPGVFWFCVLPLRWS